MSITKAKNSREFFITDTVWKACALIRNGDLTAARTVFMEEFTPPPEFSSAILPLTPEEYNHIQHIEKYNPRVVVQIIGEFYERVT